MARKGEDELLAASTTWLKEVPVGELVRRAGSRAARAKSTRFARCSVFSRVASPDLWQQVFVIPQASFRYSQAFGSGAGSLAAWLRKGELDAQKIRCAAYDRQRFQEALSWPGA